MLKPYSMFNIESTLNWVASAVGLFLYPLYRLHLTPDSLGADVSHPGPGSTLPSISALVASVDPWACVYAASIRVQDSRTEIIQDLAEMLMVELVSCRTLLFLTLFL
jgi:hypothetical protein